MQEQRFEQPLLLETKKPPLASEFAGNLKTKKATDFHQSPVDYLLGGERGIRTPGASQHNGFQDRRNRPLCHLSGYKSMTLFLIFQIFLQFF